jgi:hypothetical protein
MRVNLGRVHAPDYAESATVRDSPKCDQIHDQLDDSQVTGETSLATPEPASDFA